MTQPHRIRLNGPWELISLADDQPTRLKLPQDWADVYMHARRSAVTLQRWFHRPTGITATDQLFLCIENMPVAGFASLNEHALGEVTPNSIQALDITAVMNQLAAEPQTGMSPQSRYCLNLSIAPLDREVTDKVAPEIRLEIRSAS